jgi:Purine nucleoside phosphorylase
LTVGIIGGTGIYEIVELGEDVETRVIETPYGPSPEMALFKLHDKDVVFMSRHAVGHANPPHMVKLPGEYLGHERDGVLKRIMATNAVGSLDISIRPGDLVVP